MLREVPDVRQIPGELRRRWFVSDYFNLIVWFADDRDCDHDGGGDGARIVGFHLHYDRSRDERVFMWDARPDDGGGGRLRHCAVDDGDQPGGMKMTPVITWAVAADPGHVAERFERECAAIEPALAALVLGRLRGSPSAGPAAGGA